MISSSRLNPGFQLNDLGGMSASTRHPGIEEVGAQNPFIDPLPQNTAPRHVSNNDSNGHNDNTSNNSSRRSGPKVDRGPGVFRRVGEAIFNCDVCLFLPVLVAMLVIGGIFRLMYWWSSSEEKARQQFIDDCESNGGILTRMFWNGAGRGLACINGTATSAPAAQIPRAFRGAMRHR